MWVTPIHRASVKGHTEIVRILAPLTKNPNSTTNSGMSPLHTTWQDVLIQIKSPNNLDTWNVVWTPKTTFWHNESNETLGPFWGLMVHRQKTPPNLGRMGCACQLLSPKGPKVWFNFLCQNVVSGTHLTWQVSKSFGLLIWINTCCQVVCTACIIFSR